MHSFIFFIILCCWLCYSCLNISSRLVVATIDVSWIYAAGMTWIWKEGGNWFLCVVVVVYSWKKLVCFVCVFDRLDFCNVWSVNEVHLSFAAERLLNSLIFLFRKKWMFGQCFKFFCYLGWSILYVLLPCYCGPCWAACANGDNNHMHLLPSWV